MRVGLFHRGSGRRLVDQCVRSVRGTMPGVPIDEMTGEGPLALACLKAYASVSGEWLFLDTDTIVQRDVRSVFDTAFDVAVATRDGTLFQREVGTKLMIAMPYNKGVVFSRSHAFWVDAVRRCEGYKASRREWMGDQQAMNAVIAEHRYHVVVLPNSYNYPPKSRNEDVRDKYILHFKGPRKAWLQAAA